MDIVIESGNPIDVFINNQSPIVKPDIHDIVIENVTERGFDGAIGPQGPQGNPGPIGPQGIPGTGILQLNHGPIASNSTLILDSLDPILYNGCQWLVTVVDAASSLYRSGVISSTIDSWCHYAIIGDQILYRLTVANLTLSITNNHPNPIYVSVIRLPTVKP